MQQPHPAAQAFGPAPSPMPHPPGYAQPQAQTEHFNVGSPSQNNWSPLNPNQAPAGNASFGAWAPGAGTEHDAFDAKAWSVDNKKVTKELRAFDGDMASYDNWRRRIRDHFMSINCNYSKIFSIIEEQKQPILWAHLPRTRRSPSCPI